MTASNTDTAQTEQSNEYPLEEEYGVDVIEYDWPPSRDYEARCDQAVEHIRSPFTSGHWWERTDDDEPDWFAHRFNWEPCATLEELSPEHVPEVPESVDWPQYRHYTCQHPGCHDDCINRRDTPYAITGTCRLHFSEDDLFELNPCRITALPAEHRPDVSDSVEWSEYEHYMCRKCQKCSLCINRSESIYARSRLCRLCYVKWDFYTNKLPRA